jgi:hypothetical protein
MLDVAEVGAGRLIVVRIETDRVIDAHNVCVWGIVEVDCLCDYSTLSI